MATRKKINPAWLLVPLIIGILLFSVITWLSSSETYSSNTHTYTITGWEVLHRLHPSFFVWVWLGLTGTVIFGALAYFNETGTWIGARMNGNDTLTVVLVILALICLFAPWIKAFEAKGDGGATLPQEETSKSIRNESTGTYYLPTGFDCTPYSTDGLFS
jgi:hypothetical protein